jgi:Arc/MetJ family transcription regulator
VHKTTLVVDDKKLARAGRILGTRGIRQTIDRALDEVLALDARRRALERLRKLDGLDLGDPTVMAEAWR